LLAQVIADPPEQVGERAEVGALGDPRRAACKNGEDPDGGGVLATNTGAIGLYERLGLRIRARGTIRVMTPPALHD
jgi:hypothetical protein